MTTKEKPLSHTLKSISPNVKKIMPEICGVLDKNNIKYVTNPKRTEIIIPDKKMSEVKDLVESGVSVGKQTLKYAVDFIKLKETVYIRQKVQ